MVIQHQTQGSIYKSVCNVNIYNAFLIANYRTDIAFKDKEFIRKDLKFGLGFLAYFTALIQWTALGTMIAAFIDESRYKIELPESFYRWQLFPENMYSLLMWPFFAIAAISTYKQYVQNKIDIQILKQWNINAHRYHFLLL